MGNSVSRGMPHHRINDNDANSNLLWAVEQLGRWEERMSDSQEDRKMLAKEVADQKSNTTGEYNFPSLSKKYIYAHNVLQQLSRAAEQDVKLASTLKEKRAYLKRHPSRKTVETQFQQLQSTLQTNLSNWENAQSAAMWLQNDYVLHFSLKKVMELIVMERQRLTSAQGTTAVLAEQKQRQMQIGDAMVTGQYGPSMQAPEASTLGLGGGVDTSSSSSSSSDEDDRHGLRQKVHKMGNRSALDKCLRRKKKLEQKIFKHQLEALRIGFAFLDVNNTGYIGREAVPDLDPRIFTQLDKKNEGRITAKELDRVVRELHREILDLDKEIDQLQKEEHQVESADRDLRRSELPGPAVSVGAPLGNVSGPGLSYPPTTGSSVRSTEDLAAKRELLSAKLRARYEKRRMYDEICTVVSQSFTNYLLRNVANVSNKQITEHLAAITQHQRELEYGAVRASGQFMEGS